MRRLGLAALVMVFLAGCDNSATAQWCYWVDDTGTLRDSVRPDPGYVCVATVTVTTADSVRPDPGTGGGSAAMRSAPDMRASTVGGIKLRPMKREELKPYVPPKK